MHCNILCECGECVVGGGNGDDDDCGVQVFEER